MYLAFVKLKPEKKKEKSHNLDRVFRQVIVSFIGFSALLMAGSNCSSGDEKQIRATQNENTIEASANSGEWKVPPEANKLKNPCAGKAEETAKGKNSYNIYCAVCHGNGGRGDGESGKALNPKPADYASPAVQQQTDGALFWRMTHGRGGTSPMIAYKDILTDEQRWQLVNCIRELGKK